MGLMASTTAGKTTLFGAGLLLWVIIPALTQNALTKIERTIESASRRRAGALLRTLRSRLFVSVFAPRAWVSLQEARLHLKLGDGKAAARGFAETARRCRQPDAVMLVSAQAHALVVAGDRKNARKLLNKLSKAKLLSPRDQLDLAIVLLTTSEKKARQALAYVDAARKTIGEHPRLIAAHALALLQLEKVDEASEQLERAQIFLQEDPDPVVDDLVRRGRLKLRQVIEGQLRLERRARSRQTTIVVTSDTAAIDEIVAGSISGLSDGEKVEAAKRAAAQEAHQSLTARGWNDPNEGTARPSDGTKVKRRAIHKQSVSYDDHGRRTFAQLKAVPESAPTSGFDIELDGDADEVDLAISVEEDEPSSELSVASQERGRSNTLVDAAASTPALLEGSDLGTREHDEPGEDATYAPPAPSPPAKGLFRAAPSLTRNGDANEDANEEGRDEVENAGSVSSPKILPPVLNSPELVSIFSPPQASAGNTTATRRPLGSAFAVHKPGESIARARVKREDSGDVNSPR
jgi:tetratricopeptide (TPR) repeat protein